MSSDDASVMGSRPSDSSPSWFLLTVNSHSEKKVASVLEAKGFEVFLPLCKKVSQWSDRVKAQQLPLFPCFLFCRYDHPKDHVRVVSTLGVLVGGGVNRRPTPVPEAEIVALRKVTTSGFAVEAAPYPGGGTRVRMETDSLSGLEGLLTRDESTCRVVVNMKTIGRAVAMEIPRELVVPFAEE